VYVMQCTKRHLVQLHPPWLLVEADEGGAGVEARRRKIKRGGLFLSLIELVTVTGETRFEYGDRGVGGRKKIQTKDFCTSAASMV
jgi:hypothetical protein